MADLYSISNWDRIFENNRSREIKELNWVAIPNRHDGSKFAELMSHKNGAQHFAAWILIVQVASRVRDSRGILRRGDGTPHTPLSLSLVTRCPENIFSEAIPRLFNLGWLKLEGNKQIPHLGAAIPHLGAAEGEGTGGDRIELEGSGKTMSPEGDRDGLMAKFEEARKNFPGSKRGLSTEWGEFNRKHKKRVAEILPLLLPAIESQRKYKDKLDKLKVFVPQWKNFKTWISQSSWEDEPSKEIYVKDGR